MSKKILIVEDEKPLANALELKLTHSGFEVKVTYDGIDALETIKKDHYDLILLDLVMPNMDGFSVLSKLRESKNNTKVIVTSNLSQSEDIEKATDLGALDYFVKSDTSLSKIVEYINTAFQNDTERG